jgi:hypothetical protein
MRFKSDSQRKAVFSQIGRFSKSNKCFSNESESKLIDSLVKKESKVSSTSFIGNIIKNEVRKNNYYERKRGDDPNIIGLPYEKRIDDIRSKVEGIRLGEIPESGDDEILVIEDSILENPSPSRMMSDEEIVIYNIKRQKAKELSELKKFKELTEEESFDYILKDILEKAK